MKLHTIHLDDILISKTRQRKNFSPEEITKLAGSISENGLISPIVVRKDEDGNIVLVAGERRIRALVYVWNFGQKVKCGEYSFDEGQIPCIYQGEMDPLAAFEMELEENIRRVDLSWQERATATSQLYELRRLQAEKRGEKAPTVADISSEVHGTSPSAWDQTRTEILVSKHLADPDVAKAASASDAFKILKRKEEIKRNEELAIEVGATFKSTLHDLFHGDCLGVLKGFPDGQFDVILSDPPYGIDADAFGDSGGMAAGSHFYDDSWTNWNRLMRSLAPELFRVAKPQSHLYLFCDVDNFVLLKSFMLEAGWKVFRTPFIWVNPAASRAPWPEQGPQRKYQIILYAIKGNRPVSRIYPDVLTYPNDQNLGHPAQKPVALFKDLLQRSVHPGDVVLDPFMGSGTILPAAHEMKCKAVGVEVDAAAYGIAIGRLKELD